MFEPSLFLLILKALSVFCVSFAAGWSITYRRFTDIAIVNWTICTILGVAFLNFICLLSVILNFPGWAGLVPTGILFLIKLAISLYKRTISSGLTQTNLKQAILAICVLSSISTLNYFAPFLAEGTSGYYSRGGGDHSTYLVLSDYYSKHSFWEELHSPFPMPPKQSWEAREFAHNRMSLNPENIQPYANQLIATPYMSILPGATEETYSAVVAFYISMAMWSVIALGMLFLRRNTLPWLFFIPLFLSNVTLYNATTHSIPYLFSISIMNAVIMLFWIYTRNESWKTSIAEYRHYLPLGILCSTLMEIYPHGYFMTTFFIGVMAITSSTLEEFKRFIVLGLATVIFSFAAVNFILLTNIPLVIAGLGGHFPFTVATHLTDIIMAQTGIPDLLSTAVLPRSQTIIIVGLFFIFISLAARVILSANSRVRWLLITLFLVPWFSILSYYLRGEGSYQIVRFLELVNLYVLGFAGFGMCYFIEKKRSPLLLGSIMTAMAILVSFQVVTHSHTVKEVLNVDPVFGTEFRDSKALIAIKKLQAVQNADKSADHIAYYFGPGDGVDFAGGAVLLRNGDYLPARGNTLAPWFDVYAPGTNTRVWKKAWLDNAFLVIRSEGKVDVVDDTRTSAFSQPLLDTPRLKIYDSSIQPLTQLVGDSWGALQFYPSREDKDAKPFRYLQRQTGAVVIWSQSEQKVHLNLYLTASVPEAKVQLISQLLNETNKNYDVPVWAGVIPTTPCVSAEVKLAPGANVIEVTPQANNVTLYVWKVTVV
ncbi:MAG: hypothetical protein P4M14_01555 [Gammaproteobacteria bacterium]|nr:hypothetical protein [Gammaproteobacteria bacterium]